MADILRAFQYDLGSPFGKAWAPQVAQKGSEIAQNLIDLLGSSRGYALSRTDVVGGSSRHGFTRMSDKQRASEKGS